MFAHVLDDEATLRDARADYRVAARLHVWKLPSLVVGDADGLAIVAHGYRSAAGIYGSIMKWLDSLPAMSS